jgi:hypothetical protein
VIFAKIFFITPPIKVNLGQANKWGTTNSKPPGPIIMMSQLGTVIRSKIAALLRLSPATGGKHLALHTSRSRITSNLMRMWEGKLRTREDAGANCLISKMHFCLIISKIAQLLEKLTV